MKSNQEPQDASVAARVQEMVRRIVDGFRPERIILFGSHARGTAEIGRAHV